MLRLLTLLGLFLHLHSAFSQQRFLLHVIESELDTLHAGRLGVRYGKMSQIVDLKPGLVLELPILTMVHFELAHNGLIYTKSIQTSADSSAQFTWMLTGHYVLDEIAVRAQQLDAKQFSSNRVLSKDEIDERRSEKDIPFVLQYLTSVVSQSDAGNGVGYTAFRVRGIDPSHVQCNINGIPYTDAESSLTYFVDVPDILTSTQELVLWKGNIPSRAGPGNFGAALDLQTHRFAEKAFCSLSARYASFNTRALSIQAQTNPVLKNLRLLLSAHAQHSDGFIDRSKSKLGSLSIAAQKLNPNHHYKIIYLLGGEQTQQAWFGLPHSFFYLDSLYRFNAAGTSKPGDPYDKEVDRYTQQHLQFFYDLRLSNLSLISFKANYTRGGGYFENYIADADYSQYGLVSTPDASGDLIRRKHLSNHFFFGSLHYQDQWAENRQYWLGLQGSYYLGNHFGSVPEVIDKTVDNKVHEYYRNRGIKWEFSPFLKWELWNSSKLQLFCDFQLRYLNYRINGTHDVYSRVDADRSFFFFRPLMFLNYKIGRHWTLNFSTGYMQREPFREEILADAINVRHEKLWDTELGLNWHTEKWSLRNNLYYMAYRNQLAITGAINDVGEPIKINIPTSFRAGIESDVEYRAARFLDFTANFNASFNRANTITEVVPVFDSDFNRIMDHRRVHRHTPLAFSPPFVGNVGLDITLIRENGPRPSCAVSYRHQYVGNQYIDNTGSAYSRLPAYDLGAIVVRIQSHRTKKFTWSIQGQLNNVWNERYSTHGWITRFKYADDSLDFGPYSQTEGDNIVSYKGLYPQAYRNAAISVNFTF